MTFVIIPSPPNNAEAVIGPSALEAPSRLYFTEPFKRWFLSLQGRLNRPGAPNLPTSTSYANDAAAAVGGVEIGEFYRNGSVVQCRIA